MHNHNDKGVKSMMWMMVICCALPLLFIIIAGTGSRSLGVSTWVILGVIAVIVIARFFVVSRSHQNSDNEEHATIDEENNDKNTKDGKNNSGHGCCH